MARLFALFITTLMACQQSNQPISQIDWQGHRGARGVYPENSLPAFKYALEQGMTTLEMDVVITADSQVVVSHEPFMSAAICLNAAGGEIAASEERSFNIFGMTYAEVQLFDCGSKGNERFPEQQKQKTFKPILGEVIRKAERWAEELDREPPYYNIEIKSRPAWDAEYHPVPAVYADLVMREIKEGGVMERSIIQSFDYRPLQYLHQQGAGVHLALLVEDRLPPSEHLLRLGFVPAIYSPYYLLVDKKLVALCRKEGMKLIPWTVNDSAAADQLLELGVDGIITDYPELKNR